MSGTASTLADSTVGDSIYTVSNQNASTARIAQARNTHWRGNVLDTVKRLDHLESRLSPAVRHIALFFTDARDADRDCIGSEEDIRDCLNPALSLRLFQLPLAPAVRRAHVVYSRAGNVFAPS